MKNNAFTLIELLAVIVILAIIALIAVPIVINIISDSKKSSQIESIKMYAKMVEKAAGTYVMKHPKEKNITIEKLNSENLINYKGDPIECKTVQIWYNGEIYVGDCTVGGIEVDYSYGEYKPIPELDKGLTPVVYVDESTPNEPTKGYWKVVDKNDPNWYDYKNQKWANAVVLSQTAKNNNKNKVGSIVTVDGNNPDVLMMMVWIPRYEYKIEGDYGKGGTSYSSPGEIEVNFIPPTKLKSSKEYILHPAFEFGNNENNMQHLSGIWVGKFELSHVTKSKSNSETDSNASLNCTYESCDNVEDFRILPNVPSLRYNDVSNYYYSIKNIENILSFGLSNTDTHMMKNSEWGAVAYLSQSKYGKYGNSEYIGENKEVYQNKSNQYITGSSNGTPSPNVNNGRNPQYKYNEMIKLANGKGIAGPGASTTGNIYGIYDMSGGSLEYVMGMHTLTVYNTDEFISIIFSKNSKIESKYYNSYVSTGNTNYSNPNKSCDGGVCYGHALSETRQWYNDQSYQFLTFSPWILRGCAYNYLGAGVFGYDNGTGDGNYNYSTRVVFVSK